MIDVHPTSGDILVGGLVQFEPQKNRQSFLYCLDGKTDAVLWSVSLPFMNMGVLAVKFVGNFAVLLQYSLNYPAYMTEFLSELKDSKTADSRIYDNIDSYQSYT